MSSAERTRRWRKNTMAGDIVALVKVGEADTEALVQMRLLNPWETDDRKAVATAVARLLRMLRSAA